MTLGELKAEAMRLMFVQGVSAQTVEDLEFDENNGDLYRGIVGALNRAFADLEAKRILPARVAKLTVQREASGTVWLSLESVCDYFAPIALSFYDGEGFAPVSFAEQAGMLRADSMGREGTYELLYHPLLARVTDETPNSTVLDLPPTLVEALPYFVKGDVYRVDEPNEAAEARNFYEAAVAQYAARVTSQQSVVDDVYEGLV